MKQIKKKPQSRISRSRRNLFLISLVFLFLKLILIFSVKNGAWLGADGESYIKGADGLLRDGFLSKEGVLTYWPAGYPILIWFFVLITSLHFSVLLSIFQTVIYFAAVAFFAEKLRQSRFNELAMPVAFILAIDPTLTLSSMAIGYESLVASALLLTLSCIMHAQQNPDKKTLIKAVVGVGLLQGFASFLQPRTIIFGVAILIIWIIRIDSRKTQAIVLTGGLFLLAIFPATLIFRNLEANGVATISNNLGINMIMGAGDKATGGYGNSGAVVCLPKKSSAIVSDNQKVTCVLAWYLKHPTKSLHLALNKSVYFWSPWYGPLANGTMARNPWLKINPLVNMASSVQGRNLVFGAFGKVVSWIWLLSGLGLFFYGWIWLWQSQKEGRMLALLCGTPVVLAWLTAIGTFGDHRFRLPTMGLSLFLQVAGSIRLKQRISGAFQAPTLDPRGKRR